jgi:hypothetical protein
LDRFIENPKAWRAFIADYYEISESEAKKQILSMFFGGLPFNDNPLLWAVAREMHRLRAVVLALPRFAYPNGLFERPKSPAASKFACVLFSVEDEIIQQLQARMALKFTQFHMTALVFDGILIAVQHKNEQIELDLMECFKEFAKDTGFDAILETWAAPVVVAEV